MPLEGRRTRGKRRFNWQCYGWYWLGRGKCDPFLTWHLFDSPFEYIRLEVFEQLLIGSYSAWSRFQRRVPSSGRPEPSPPPSLSTLFSKLLSLPHIRKTKVTIFPQSKRAFALPCPLRGGRDTGGGGQDLLRKNCQRSRRITVSGSIFAVP